VFKRGPLIRLAWPFDTIVVIPCASNVFFTMIGELLPPDLTKLCLDACACANPNMPPMRAPIPETMLPIPLNMPETAPITDCNPLIMALAKLPLLVAGIKMLVTGALWAARLLMANPIGLVLTAVAMAAYLLYTNWSTIVPKLKSIWSTIKSDFMFTVDYIKTAIKTKLVAIKTNIMSSWGDMAALLKNKFAMIKNSISTALSGAKASAVAQFNSIKAGIVTVLSSLKAGAMAKLNDIKSSFVANFNAIKTKISAILTAIKTSASMRDFNLALGKSGGLLDLASKGLNKLTGAIESMTKFANQHPTITKFTMYALAAFGALAVLGGGIALAAMAFKSVAAVFMFFGNRFYNGCTFFSHLFFNNWLFSFFFCFHNYSFYCICLNHLSAPSFAFSLAPLSKM